MNRIPKRLLLAVLLLCSLLLTGCYTDSDPWPAADDLSAPSFTHMPTAAPTAEPTASPTAAPVSAPHPGTQEPPADEVDVSPNFNG